MQHYAAKFELNAKHNEELKNFLHPPLQQKGAKSKNHSKQIKSHAQELEIKKI